MENSGDLAVLPSPSSRASSITLELSQNPDKVSSCSAPSGDAATDSALSPPLTPARSDLVHVCVLSSQASSMVSSSHLRQPLTSWVWPGSYLRPARSGTYDACLVLDDGDTDIHVTSDCLFFRVLAIEGQKDPGSGPSSDPGSALLHSGRTSATSIAPAGVPDATQIMFARSRPPVPPPRISTNVQKKRVVCTT